MKNSILLCYRSSLKEGNENLAPGHKWFIGVCLTSFNCLVITCYEMWTDINHMYGVILPFRLALKEKITL